MLLSSVASTGKGISKRLMLMMIFRDYKTQLTKVNLFDEYVQLRAKELVDQNEYLLEHEGKQKINE